MMIEPSWNSGEWPKNIGVNAQAWIDKLLRRLLDEQLRWVESERLRTRCVLRLGPIRDETLNARPLGLLRMANAASSAYLARYGVPRSLVDLRRQEHRTVHFSTMLGARPIGWEYPVGDSYATLQLPGAIHVNSAQTYEAAALAGLGLIQAPLLGIGRYLESGALVEILPDFVAGRSPCPS